MRFSGTSGNDTINGTENDDTFDLSQGGNDTVHGKDGDDTFSFKETFTAKDSVDGGAGNDTLALAGDYSAGVTLTKHALTSVELIHLAGGHDYKLTTADDTVARGAMLTVDARHLNDKHIFTFDGSKEKNGWFDLTGGQGNDTLTGGHRGDIFHLERGGDDTVTGAGGNDVFDFGATFDGADKISGGKGNDTLALDGEYFKKLTPAFGALDHIEAITLAAGHDYNLDLVEAVTGHTMTVDASALGTGDTLTLTIRNDVAYTVQGGQGDDKLTAGATQSTKTPITLWGNGGDDTFNIQDTARAKLLTANGGDGDDTFKCDGQAIINGGAGNDTVILDNTSVENALKHFSGVETIKLGSHASYSLTVSDNMAPDGGTLTIDASRIGTGTLHLDVKAEAFDVSVTGGKGGDSFLFTDNFTAADHIDGGRGSDTLTLDGGYSAGLTFGATTIAHVETITLIGDNSYSLTTDDANVGAHHTLEVDAGALVFSNDSLTFDGSAENDGSFDIIDGGGNDTITTGARDDHIQLLHGGEDTVDAGGSDDIIDVNMADTANDDIHGGNGEDTINVLSFGGTFDLVDGGNGNDTLAFDCNAATPFALTAGELSGIETVSFAGAFNYNVSIEDGVVGATETLTIDASAMSAGHKLTFNGAAESDGHFLFKSGGGLDVFTGGAQSDTFDYNDGITLSGETRDVLHAFDFGNDIIQFSTVNGINAEVTTGDLAEASFDTDMEAAIGSVELAAGHAVLFHPDGGDLEGDTFLIVDGNGVAGYQAGSDLVIQLSSPLNIGGLNTGNFIS